MPHAFTPLPSIPTETLLLATTCSCCLNALPSSSPPSSSTPSRASSRYSSSTYSTTHKSLQPLIRRLSSTHTSPPVPTHYLCARTSQHGTTVRCEACMLMCTEVACGDEEGCVTRAWARNGVGSGVLMKRVVEIRREREEMERGGWQGVVGRMKEGGGRMGRRLGGREGKVWASAY
ncbi:hypothetical protein BJ508DRAFT_40568 [Ascobolus immersus RN42]|uniref:Uncharacterized protein n=1 Tax=Ascobolus immersus RN42 TaxID=1160509 RepID=A0A3N4HLH2_ASCIM|nr:hypothetical protein BJ508DRAFT_40568 [Ascobolus immersus RN42]